MSKQARRRAGLESAGAPQHLRSRDQEPERYELEEGPAYSFGLDRRDFFRVLGGGVAVAIVFKDAIALQESGRGARRGMPQDVGSWIHIGADGNVTVLTGKVEVGQNIRTSLSQVVAEELRVPMAAITMVMGDTDLTPYDRGTFGTPPHNGAFPVTRHPAGECSRCSGQQDEFNWRRKRNLSSQTAT